MSLKLLRLDTIIVTRYTAGSYVEGNYVDGSTSQFDIKADVQPLKPYEKLNLPEGQRNKEVIKIYSEDMLQISDITDLVKADRINYNGNMYEINSVENRTDKFLPHYKSIAIRIDVDESNRQ